MTTEPISQLVAKQKQYFNSNTTKDVAFRISQLKKLKQLLYDYETKMCEAIYEDFKKSKFDVVTTELSILHKDIDIAISKVKRWSRKQRVKTNLLNFPAKSYTISEPLGTVLVIGAWNYPFLLSLAPAIAAITAGNTVVIKPSEVPWKTSNIMAEMINSNFPEEYFHVVEGGVAETTLLLDERWDKIFFTGSTTVGKIIYQAAAKHLTPVTLELGGKSPAIITKDANLKVAVNRIVWGKFLNAGQTCIAPDYILVEESIKEQLLTMLKGRIQEIDYSLSNKNITQIINEKHYHRLEQLIDKEKIYYQGENNTEKRFFSPTILKDVSFSDKIMQEEIFGPILPVISFKNIEDAIHSIKEREKPLSLYVFTNNGEIKGRIISELSFGGGAINDSVMHIANPNLPFGGVGHSGIGSYHGKSGFDAFSHRKSILEKGTLIDPKIRYSNSEKSLGIMKKLMGY